MKRKNKKTAASLLLALVVALAAPSVFAQAAPTGQGGQTTGATGTTAEGQDGVQATMRTEGGRRVYVASATIEVRGEIQRPYAFSLSGRSSLGYSYLELPVHFLQEIINAVRRAPF
jgi:hypothetical protein